MARSNFPISRLDSFRRGHWSALQTYQMPVARYPSKRPELLGYNEHLDNQIAEAQLGVPSCEPMEVYETTSDWPHIGDHCFEPTLFSLPQQAGDLLGSGGPGALPLDSYSPVSSTGMTLYTPTPSTGQLSSTSMQSSAPLLGESYSTHDRRIPFQFVQSLSPAWSTDIVTPSPKSEKNDNFPRRAASAPDVGRNKPRRRTHNAIEKRYRTRLNDKIAELRDRIPGLRVHPTEASDGHYMQSAANPAGDSNSQKINKAKVLEKATEYIQHLEACNRRLQMQLNHALLASSPTRRHDSTSQNKACLDPGGNTSALVISRAQPTEPFTYTIDDLLPDDTATFN